MGRVSSVGHSESSVVLNFNMLPAWARTESVRKWQNQHYSEVSIVQQVNVEVGKTRYFQCKIFISNFSVAGIGNNKYPLSKVNYDISLDLFEKVHFC